MYAACAEYLYSQRFVPGERKLDEFEASIYTPSQRNKPGSDLDTFPLSNGAAGYGLAAMIRQWILATPAALLEKLRFSGDKVGVAKMIL
jgi:hypothetical protein